MNEVKRYDISAFGGMSMDECSDGAYVNYEDYAALEAKCAALAAENAALKQSEKEFNNFCRQEYYGWEDNFTETPATDVFLAEVLAQGGDSAINRVIAMMNHQHPVTSKAIDIMRVHAYQLRKGIDQK